MPGTTTAEDNDTDANYQRRGRNMAAVLAYVLRVERTPAVLDAILDLPIALDRAFEHAKDENELAELVRHFDALNNNESIRATVEWTDRASAERATMLATQVHESAMRLPLTIRNEWMTWWRRQLHLHNVQQLEQCRWRFSDSRNNDTFGAPTGLDALVEQYLARYSHTNALTLATLAAFPHSRIPDAKWLDFQYRLAQLTEPMLRFAQDLVFQPDEWMNLAIYVHAGINASSTWSARRDLVSDTIQRRALEHRLKAQLLARIPRYVVSAGRLAVGKVARGHTFASLQLLLVHILLVATLSTYVYTKK